MSDQRLPPNQQLIRGQRWPVVGEKSPRVDESEWEISFGGCVNAPQSLSLEAFCRLQSIEQTIDVHCVTRWSKPQMNFRGVPLQTLMEHLGVQPTSEANFVSFIARSSRHHSTSLPLSEVMDLNPLIATHAEGEPISTEHGGPIRVVVPGKYFYKSVKWLTRVEFLSQDKLGYWESDAGYHNMADPWMEQRYVAANISKQTAKQLIDSLDFSSRDLRGISASDRDLNGLNAQNALLRDADFRSAKLRDADFSAANLSNAHLDFADLRGASFEGADLEGASLCGADLRGANLMGASLFGATFCAHDADGTVTTAAVIDGSTRIDPSSLHALTDDQQDFIRSLES